MAASYPGSWVGQWKVAGPQQEQMNRLLPAQAESLPSPAEEPASGSIQCFVLEQSGFEPLCHSSTL